METSSCKKKKDTLLKEKSNVSINNGWSVSKAIILALLKQLGLKKEQWEQVHLWSPQIWIYYNNAPLEHIYLMLEAEGIFFIDILENAYN